MDRYSSVTIFETDRNMPLYYSAAPPEPSSYGPLKPLLLDDALEEVMLVEECKCIIVYHKDWGMCYTNIYLTCEEATTLIRRIARFVGKEVDRDNPLLDGRLPDGSRVNATVFPASPEGPTLTIRKFRKDPFTIVDLITFGTLDARAAAFLWMAVEGLQYRSANVLVSGGTGSGKTTTLNVLAMFIPKDLRVITIEDTAELQFEHEHWIRLEAVPPSPGVEEVTIDTLCKNTLRMRPDRIVVGEVRGNEAKTMFTAMNTGHDGTLGTVHANTGSGSIYDKFSTGGTPWLVHDGMIKASGREHTEEAKKVMIDKFMPYFVKSKGCYNCPMHCGHVYRVQEGPYAGIEGEGCEANAINDFTSAVGCYDVPFVLKCNEVCDRLGMGVDEAGHMYAFGAELYKKGIITSKDTDGMEFRLGDQEAILEHIRKMAYREGFGDVMADLVVKGGKRIGKGAEEVARDRNLKKQLSYPLRSSYTQALSYSTSTRGSCHLKSTPFVYEMWLPAWYPMEYVRKVGQEKFGDPEACITPGNPNGKALMTTEGEYMCYVCDFTIICKFVTQKTIYDALNIADIAKMLTPLTGIEYKREDLVKTAQRINAVQRAFNCREGYRREDDYPPPATFKEYKMTFGKKVVIEQNKYDKLLDEYYTMHGVDLKTGIPTRQRLEELDLKDVADDLTKRGILKEFEKKAKKAKSGGQVVPVSSTAGG